MGKHELDDILLHYGVKGMKWKKRKAKPKPKTEAEKEKEFREQLAREGKSPEEIEEAIELGKEFEKAVEAQRKKNKGLSLHQQVDQYEKERNDAIKKKYAESKNPTVRALLDRLTGKDKTSTETIPKSKAEAARDADIDRLVKELESKGYRKVESTYDIKKKIKEGKITVSVTDATINGKPVKGSASSEDIIREFKKSGQKTTSKKRK